MFGRKLRKRNKQLEWALKRLSTLPEIDLRSDRELILLHQCRFQENHVSFNRVLRELAQFALDNIWRS